MGQGEFLSATSTGQKLLPFVFVFQETALCIASEHLRIHQAWVQGRKISELDPQEIWENWEDSKESR